MNIDSQGWLAATEEGFPAVLKVPSVRTTPLDLAAGSSPLAIVWHWTGGPCRGPLYETALAEEIKGYKPNVDRAASWHVLVAKDGRLLQSVPFNVGSWHVGKPGRFNGRLFGNINRCTVGVEIANAGKLEKVGSKFYCSPYWLNPDAPEAERQPDPKLEIVVERAMQHADGWYDAFPEAQEMAATRLLASLVATFKWPKENCVWGHRDFDSPRKIDPGPLWQDVVLPRVLARVFGS